ncbi:enhanced intracellular survival protein Eis [Alkalihalobacillus trypoxylicola]|uniref:N-acetyltransferase domain-containing protein n=1 Tax=Alkalihalobacillus trypoxylicola TaxID=519424 RepID=A0A162DDZ4_9BACI|nr:GNAT family N-acetyltransferase [Alkalihalobacillus trypoxylicola]KYG29325.1 hypothetical protein AZF04_07310 [Alkalihalobacillus trypoxylicola]
MTAFELKEFGEKHFNEALDLAEYAFQNKFTPEERKKKNELAKYGTHYGVFYEEQLAARLFLLELNIQLFDQQIKMGGISTVATYPEFRRNGLVKKLLHHSLVEMKKKGIFVSYLHPFSIPFYRKFGWELFANYIHYTLGKSQFPSRESLKGSIRRSTIEDLDIRKVYQEYVSNHPGNLIRDHIWWAKRLQSKWENHEVAISYDESKRPSGYLIYKIKDNGMKVEELIYLNEDSRIDLFSFMSQHDSMLEEITFKRPHTDEMAPLLPDPRVQQEIHPFFMARIVDVVGFLELYPFKGTIPKEKALYFHIEDPFCEWNDGYFSLHHENEKVHITKISQEQVSNNDVITISINDLTLLLFGCQTLSQLHNRRKLRASKEQLSILQTLLPELTKPEFIDFF